MREKGEVINISGEKIILRMKRANACNSCRACMVQNHSCEIRVTAKNECFAKLHDTVEVELKPSSFINAAFILYGIPLFGMFAGFLLGESFASAFGMAGYNEPIGFICGIILLIFTFAALKLFEPRLKKISSELIAVKIVEEI